MAETREGYFVKFEVLDLISILEEFPESNPNFDDFIAWVVIRWEYQTDGKLDSSLIKTAVPRMRWGEIKSHAPPTEIHLH